MAKKTKKKRAFAIMSPEGFKNFLNQCDDVKSKVDIGTMKKPLGTQSVEESFATISKFIEMGGIDWTIFDLKFANKELGAEEFLNGFKGLLKKGMGQRTHLVIIDEDEEYKPEARQKFAKLDVSIVTDASELGSPFNKMISLEEYEIRKAGEENPLFAGLHDVSDDDEEDEDSRLPGMDATTPTSVANVNKDPFSQLESEFSNDDEIDPFAMMEQNDSANNDFDDDPFADYIPNSGSKNQNNTNDFEDVSLPHGDPFADDEEFDDDEFENDYDDDDDNYDDDYEDDYDDDYGDTPLGELLNSTDGDVSLSDVLDAVGMRLSDDDFAKLSSMIAPSWDYSVEQADGIGKKRLFGGAKTKGISSSSEDELADSLYIPDMEDENGYYTPPNSAKIIVVNSIKGGSGKTTVTCGLASQLNWYFNKELMQRLTTSYTSRVLVLSLNEFDDIPVHGVGYEKAFSEENDSDGKNVAELLSRIKETGGKPTWDDIMHCFVSNDSNRVFYLPSLTTQEMLEGNISLSAEDYKDIFECCKNFFQFIVVDSPDIFYQQKNDLMNFAYSVADIICMIIEPDTRSAVNLMHFIQGLRSETGSVPLSSDKCILIVNKIVGPDNPYMPIPPVDQIAFEEITAPLSEYYSRFVGIPFTRPRGTGNVLFGTDAHVKTAFAELADDVLEMIDANDAKQEAKRLSNAKRR